MIGVILWSSVVKEKAVIWCEDHASLAYLQGRENLTEGSIWPEAGDLVELESETIETLRHARSVILVPALKRSELPSLLGEMGQGATTRQQPVLRVISNSNYAEKPAAAQKVAVAG
ncbi:MAG: hypothetical protein QM682_12785 [Paracoccus sp. (in: a-proteobacteria)]|uniref:hypothetical protein n=1 Tax=Paracoccus sp. TaxID=267 RepID=UPI0039E31C19